VRSLIEQRQARLTLRWQWSGNPGDCGNCTASNAENGPVTNGARGEMDPWWRKGHKARVHHDFRRETRVRGKKKTLCIHRDRGTGLLFLEMFKRSYIRIFAFRMADAHAAGDVRWRHLAYEATLGRMRGRTSGDAEIAQRSEGGKAPTSISTAQIRCGDFALAVVEQRTKFRR